MTRQWTFGSVRFYVDIPGRYARTTFTDGSCVHARPQPTDAADWWLHDFCHNYLAECLGNPHSATLYDVAHGIPASDYHWSEEGMVLAFTRYLHYPFLAGDADLDRLGALVDLPATRRGALALLENPQ